jgi:O-antigen/teichoic acid export membrane protein
MVWWFMNQVKSLKQVLSNKIALFTMARYFVYLLLFIRGILLASYLGVEKFGVFSMIILLGQYLTFSGGGVQFAITVLLAKDKKHTSSTGRNNLISSAINFSVLISILLIAPLIILTWHQNFFEGATNEYILFVALIGSLGFIQQVLLNIFRVDGLMKHIIIVELVTAIFLIAVIFFVSKDQLIWYMLTSVVITSLCSILYFFNKKQFQYNFTLTIKNVVRLMRTGFPLLLLNISTMIITIFPQFIAGVFYGDEVMGIYSFGVRISTSVLLVFNTIVWYIFPSLISRLGDMSPDDKYNFVKKWSTILVCLLTLFSFIMMIVMSIIFTFMPEYYDAYAVFNIIIISNIFMLSGFIFNSLIISHGGQLRLSIFITIISISVIISSYLIATNELNYIYLGLVTLMASIIHLVVNIIFGWRLALSEYSLRELYIFPVKFLLPIFAVLVLSFLLYPMYGAVIGFILLIILEGKTLLNVLNPLFRRYFWI